MWSVQDQLLSLTVSPAEFLSFYGLLNFYLYTLAFVYSPSKTALYGKPPWGQAARGSLSAGAGHLVPLLSSRETGHFHGELWVSVRIQHVCVITAQGEPLCLWVPAQA